MRDLASPGRSRTIPPAVGSFSAGRRSAACADQRSAFPCLRVALPRAKPNHPPRSRGPSLPAACGGLCRPEVGVPLPARRSAPGEAEPSPSQSGSFSAGRLRRPVPTRGRRSLACASLCSGRSRTIPSAAGSFSAGRLRRPVPTRGRRSLACASLHADWGGAVSTASRRSMPVGDRRSIPAPAARRRRAREFRIRRAAPGGPAPGPHPNELTAAPPGSQAAAPVPDR